MVYNFTNLTNSNTTLQQIMVIDQEITGGYFSILMIVSLFVILFIRFLPYNPKQAFAGAAIITNIISGLFFIAGFLNIIVVIITMVLSAIGIAIMFFFPD